jgi:hypothetical protein
MQAKRTLILSLLTTAILTLAPFTAAATISQGIVFFNIGETCFVNGHMQPILHCELAPLQAGQIILVEAVDIPVPSITDTMGDHFTLVRDVPLPGSSYDLEVFFATASASSSGDAFVNIVGTGGDPVLTVHAFYGTAGVESSSIGSGNSNTPEVTDFSPSLGTVVIAAALIQNNAGTIPTSVHAGPGYTQLSDFTGLVDEGEAASGNATTSQFVLGSPLNWAEVSVALSPAASSVPPVPQFGAPTILVAAMALIIVAVMRRSKLLKF